MLNSWWWVNEKIIKIAEMKTKVFSIIFSVIFCYNGGDENQSGDENCCSRFQVLNMIESEIISHIHWLWVRSIHTNLTQVYTHMSSLTFNFTLFTMKRVPKTIKVLGIYTLDQLQVKQLESYTFNPLTISTLTN